MSKIKLFLILSGYQITWLACVFGERFYQEPLIGFFCGLVFIIVYILNVKDYKIFFLIVLLISLPGYFFDSIIVYFKIYEFNSDIVIGFLQIWMIVLWLSFATLFYEVFIFLKNYQIIGISLIEKLFLTLSKKDDASLTENAFSSINISTLFDKLSFLILGNKSFKIELLSHK